MAVPQSRQPLPPRLHIAPHLANGPAPMFSPALLTAGAGGFPFVPPHLAQFGGALQTPQAPAFMPGGFPAPAPGAPGRPAHRTRQSLAGMSLAGMPFTPLGGGFPLVNGAPLLPPGPLTPGGGGFVPRSRRTMSVGGPPKAVLGGPKAQQPAATPEPAPAPPPVKGKKTIIRLPKETVPGENGEPSTRPEWARDPLDQPVDADSSQWDGLELTSGEELVEEPGFSRVYIPSKKAWLSIKHRDIEEKLERMGVERGGFGSNVPHIFAPHARAASISSPADPALLHFRLNKLAQSHSASVSLAPSPHPPLSSGMPSPSLAGPARFGAHGHSMSLAAPPPALASPGAFGAPSAFNPFGPYATLGSDMVPTRSPGPVIHAPQGRAPVALASFGPASGPSSRPASKPDFTRGFGLDMSEEEPVEDTMEAEVEEQAEAEAEAEEEANATAVAPDAVDDADGGAPPAPFAMSGFLPDIDEDRGYAIGAFGLGGGLGPGGLAQIEEASEDGLTTAPHSRMHSRHVSKLSAALSLASIGGPVRGSPIDMLPPSYRHAGDPPEPAPAPEAIEEDPIDEWTGSEDLRADDGDISDDESIGEWSNPSDEERARQERIHRRMVRRSRQDSPRRLPNFPRPPRGALARGDDEDDMISNPSDEERVARHGAFASPGHATFFSTGVASQDGRPLPPLPHSRTASQYSHHDPALAHSREPSGSHTALAPPPALNPNAKPFVFGAPRAPAVPSGLGGHSRGPSFSSSLNKALSAAAPTFTPGSLNVAAPAFTPTGSFNPAAPVFNPAAPVFTPGVNVTAHTFTPSGAFNLAAPAFKPVASHGSGGFNFRPPEDAPQMPVPSPARPLPAPPPPSVAPVRAQQGREKRIRLDRGASDGEEDSDAFVNRIASFKFPTPQKMAAPGPPRPDSAPVSPTRAHAPQRSQDEEAAISLAGFNPTWPANFGGNLDGAGDAEANARTITLNSESGADELPVPPQFKPKRAPIPLDFTHPVSTNTVPAGLFKNLANGEDRTRRATRSRLASASGEVFEHMSRPSLDDIDVLAISLSRKPAYDLDDDDEQDMLPGPMSLPLLSAQTVDRARRASFPGHSAQSSGSAVALPPMQVDGRIDLRAVEQRLAGLLERKMLGLREDLLEQQIRADGAVDARVRELLSLVSEQLRRSPAHAPDESFLDAKGELDYDILRENIEQVHAHSRTLIQLDLENIMARIEAHARQQGQVTSAAWQDVSQRTLAAVHEATSRLNSSAVSPPVSADVVADLLPHLESLRADPIDYDALTMQLSQAVKPHISQLIDLASDKRETAVLIVKQLQPVLAAIRDASTPVDINALASQLTAEVRRVVAPVDAHEIKEQVSDLVVERLDSRLTNRDKALNLDGIAAKVTESMSGALQPLVSVVEATEKFSAAQQALSTDTQDLLSSHKILTALISDLPGQLVTATEALRATEGELRSSRDRAVEAQDALRTISGMSSSVHEMSATQGRLHEQLSELVSLQRDVANGMNSLPDVLVETTSVLAGAQDGILSREAEYKRDFAEVVRGFSSQSELQVQLQKARGAHGQIRVEKDMLNERLMAADVERERLRSELEAAKAAREPAQKALAELEAKNKELNQSLVDALQRQQEADAKVKSLLEENATLSRQRTGTTSHNFKLEEQTTRLQARIDVLEKEKEIAEQTTTSTRAELERALAGQSQLNDMKVMIEGLNADVRAAHAEELGRAAQRASSLEAEIASLRQRSREQEARVDNTERAAALARQTLSQAQSRAADAERRAGEHESEARAVSGRLEVVEAARTSLEVEFAAAQARLEQKEADDRMNKDRENKLKDQVAAMEGQLAQLKVAMQQQQPAFTTPAKQSTMRNGTHNSSYVGAPNGRAVSPTSTAYGPSRSATPVGNSPAVAGPQPSVWDSMHAPKTGGYPASLAPGSGRRPQPMHAPSYRAASPAASVVSVAPTEGADGWWS